MKSNMTQAQREWVADTAEQALLGAHIFPVMAACEAALESGYGQSKLARDGCNLFGMKQAHRPRYGTLTLPTQEWDQGKGMMVDVMAEWVRYPTIADCFLDRMATLLRLSPHYHHYRAALDATDPQDYIREVSLTWSTDPERGHKALLIFATYNSGLAEETLSSTSPYPRNP